MTEAERRLLRALAGMCDQYIGGDDFLGSESFEDALFVAHDLALGASDLILTYHRQWVLGRGKWVMRGLRRFDPQLADGREVIGFITGRSKEITEPNGPANGSQPISPETSRTSSADGSRR